GYRTLSVAEFLALSSRKGGPRRGRHVLLTFDDARLNFHQTALPVLRATGAHAALFAPTLWMDNSGPPGAERFMDWAQLRECVESGLVDVGSHAHRHALVFDGDRLAGFATPWLLERYDIYDWPMRHGAGGDRLGRPQPGTPIYDATPLLSARSRYLESEALRTACTELVERSGGDTFFARPDCYSLLTRLHRSLASSLRGRFASARELEALVASEFERRSKSTWALRRRPSPTPGPWARRSPSAWRGASESAASSAWPPITAARARYGERAVSRKSLAA